MARRIAKIERVQVSTYDVPTETPESDGTLRWDATTCVVVEVEVGGARGLGYTYSDPAAAELIRAKLAPIVIGADAGAPEAAGLAMLRAVRNAGRQGIAAHAISAVDIALWDLKARMLDTSLVRLWGAVRGAVPAYASGGFTSYDELHLREQLTDWRDRGFAMAKIKIGRLPLEDLSRVALAREVLGPEIGLFVDANGAYSRKQALFFADAWPTYGITWFEEPVSSDDLEGLRLVRDRAPGGVNVTAGEYGYHPFEFRRLLESGAVDILQADVTRCLGFTGMRKVAALCDAWGLPLSAHGAPALSAHIGATLAPFVHLEYFHDHVRLEAELFDGLPPLVDGSVRPDPAVAGHGLSLSREGARRHAA